jgi:hypothetical protein
MKKVLEIPQELLEHLEYDEASPSGLIWIKSTNRSIKVGDIAGSKDKTTGYWGIKFRGKNYLCHRIIYKLHNKINIQHTEIDHEDKNPDNNKIENLRIATGNEQQWNQGIPKNNTSGIKGVHLHKQANKWHAQIQKNGKHYYLGLFEDIKEAEKVVMKAREELHGKFACHGENNIPKPENSQKLTIFDI